MKAQEPAEGILKINDWGNAKMYTVRCTCGNPDDDVDFEVEADDVGIHIYTYTKQKTEYWADQYGQNKSYSRFDNTFLYQFDYMVRGFLNALHNRIKMTYKIWVHGYVEYSQNLIMTEQQALNYATTLTNAINDVKEFSKNNRKDSK